MSCSSAFRCQTNYSWWVSKCFTFHKVVNSVTFNTKILYLLNTAAIKNNKTRNTLLHNTAESHASSPRNSSCLYLLSHYSGTFHPLNVYGLCTDDSHGQSNSCLLSVCLMFVNSNSQARHKTRTFDKRHETGLKNQEP